MGPKSDVTEQNQKQLSRFRRGGKNKKNQLRKEVNQGKKKQTDGWTW